MSVKLLTEHHLKFLSLKGVCTGSSESTLVKMPHCWKSGVTAHLISILGHLSLTLLVKKIILVFEPLKNVLLTMFTLCLLLSSANNPFANSLDPDQAQQYIRPDLIQTI